MVNNERILRPAKLDKGVASPTMTDDELRLNIASLHAACHELFQASQRHDAQIAQNATYIRALAQIADETLGSIKRLEQIANNTLDSIKRLERVATAHQDRLDDQEERIEDLES
jgi:septal ring factor EnvC (AmiA/AmiB activator)